MEFGLGILPKNRKFSEAIIMAMEESPKEVSGYRIRPGPEVRDQAVLTQEAVRITESQWVSSASSGQLCPFGLP